MAFNTPDWGRILAATGQGLMQAGQPGANLGNFGTGLMQGAQFYDQGVDRRRARELEDIQLELARQEQEAQRLAETEAANQQRVTQEYINSLPPEQQGFAMAFPDQAGGLIKAQQFPEAKDPESPKTTGGMYWDQSTGTFKPIPGYTEQAEAIARAGRGPAESNLTERQRNALAAGLQPGTPEYQQYILGRDDTAPGPFQGTGLDAQSYNILLTGDPASPEFAAAYMQLAQPKTQLMPDGTVQTVAPDMSWARKPAGAAASPQQTPGAQTSQLPGATVTTLPGSGVTPQDRQKLRSVKAEATAIKDALTRFKDVVMETGAMERASAATGGLTEGGRKLNSAWTNAAIMTKAEALFNLGVLNGPDLSVIQGTLPNPSTLSGAIASDDAYNTAIDEVLSLIDNKVKSFESQYGGTPYTRGGGAPDSTTDPLGIR